MADSLGEWIGKSVIQHDQTYGANLEVPWTRERICQVVGFDTYRDEDHPKAEIRGRISDRKHWVRVVFDKEMTDVFERSPAIGVRGESLTSHLRAVLKIKSYKFRLRPPEGRRQQRGVDNLVEIPRLELYITAWQVDNGDHHDPVFYPEATEVGTGSNDDDVRRVLRKWYYGESNSDISQPDQKPPENQQPEAGPSRPRATISRSVSTNRSISVPISRAGSTSTPRRITLLEYIQPHLNPHGEKRSKKPIPDYFWEVPAAQRAELDAITVFGVDITKGKGKQRDNSDRSSSSDWIMDAVLPIEMQVDQAILPLDGEEMDQKEVPYVDIRHRSDRFEMPEKTGNSIPLANYLTEPQRSVHRTTEVPADGSSEDEGIIIRRPRVPTKPKLKGRFELISHSSELLTDVVSIFSEDRIEREQRDAFAALNSEMREEEGDEDPEEDGLSDYERESRRKKLKDRSQQKDLIPGRVQDDRGLGGDDATNLGVRTGGHSLVEENQVVVTIQSSVRQTTNNEASQGSTTSPSIPGSQRSTDGLFSSAFHELIVRSTPNSQGSVNKQTISVEASQQAQQEILHRNQPRKSQILVDDSESAGANSTVDSKVHPPQTTQPTSSHQRRSASPVVKNPKRLRSDVFLESQEADDELSQSFIKTISKSRLLSPGQLYPTGLGVPHGPAESNDTNYNLNPTHSNPLASSQPSSKRVKLDIATTPSNQHTQDSTPKTQSSSSKTASALGYLNPFRYIKGTTSRSSPKSSPKIQASTSGLDVQSQEGMSSPRGGVIDMLASSPGRGTQGGDHVSKKGGKGSFESIVGILWGRGGERGVSPVKVAGDDGSLGHKNLSGEMVDAHQTAMTVEEEDTDNVYDDSFESRSIHPSDDVNTLAQSYGQTGNQGSPIRTDARMTTGAFKQSPNPPIISQVKYEPSSSPRAMHLSSGRLASRSTKPVIIRPADELISRRTIVEPLVKKGNSIPAEEPEIQSTSLERRGKGKLGGFKPALIVDQGLSEEWVRKSEKVAKDQRARLMMARKMEA